MTTPEPIMPARRCAIYTRKSVQQDPTHQFSSLEAQRSICCSYIASQRPKGWTEVVKHYDDNGQSGGDLRRPALQELLSDIESGLIDVVVIYKMDRITRTLLDFVRLMDLFEQFGVGFVFVTQNFDTADSTGRLILNILLTFAPFEREIASDRLRDKFGAMRQRGMFVGRNPPFGYNLVEKKLIINGEEGKVVRWMFQRYLETKSYVTVAKELREKGVIRRSRTSKRGNYVQGRGICVSSVWNMLGNPLYVGTFGARASVIRGCTTGLYHVGFGTRSRRFAQNVRALSLSKNTEPICSGISCTTASDGRWVSFGIVAMPKSHDTTFPISRSGDVATARAVTGPGRTDVTPVFFLHLELESDPMKGRTDEAEPVGGEQIELVERAAARAGGKCIISCR